MDWMSKLSDESKSKPISHLAIPGSHDSAAYHLDPNGPLSPDQKEIFKLFKNTVHNWSITQTLTLKEQLEIGIRYFDLRIAKHPKTGDLCFVHGLYGITVKSGLAEINTFLVSQPNELVILDFNHLLSFDETCYKQLFDVISNSFGNKLADRETSFANTTLLNLLKQGKQVVAFSCSKNSPKFLWPDCLIQSPWPNLQDSSQLIKYLEKEICKRDPECCYVSQGILTPNTDTIVSHLFSSLKEWEKGVPKEIENWVNQIPTPSQLNIIICDFVTEDYAQMVYKRNV